MTTATLEIYRTESGAVYEVVGRRVRRTSTTGDGPIGDWQDYVAINRLPAALMRPGSQGEVLEILLVGGRRIYTSRLVVPTD